jgi:hypothetical protein
MCNGAERLNPHRAGWLPLLMALAVLLSGCGAPPTAKTQKANPPTANQAQVQRTPADNSYCYVCHVNYQEEALVKSHETAGIGCEKCHGMSVKHSADEDNLTAPDLLYAESRVAPFCLSCHAQEKLAKDSNHQAVFSTKAGSPQRCTECHGDHRLKNRTRRWDKDTGKLVWKDSGPVMDR